MQRYRLADARRNEVTSNGLMPSTKGNLVLYADAIERERALREEIERLKQALSEAHQQAIDAAFRKKPKMSKAEKEMYNCEG